MNLKNNHLLKTVELDQKKKSKNFNVYNNLLKKTKTKKNTKKPYLTPAYKRT